MLYPDSDTYLDSIETPMPDPDPKKCAIWFSKKQNIYVGIVFICSVVEPEPQGARTFGRSQSWNRNDKVLALAPAPGSGSESA